LKPENNNGAPGPHLLDLLNTWVSGLAAGFGGEPRDDLSLFLPPPVACLVIVAIHCISVLRDACEVIFVDLSLAQWRA
jgi:hypothetical protein